MAALDVAVGLGEFENALTTAQQVVKLAPKERDFGNWANAQRNLARVYARFGKAAEAVAILRQLFDTPGTGDIVDPLDLQLHPMWDPIRRDQQFQKLLLDYPPTLPNE